MVCDQIHYPNNYLDSFPYIEHLDHYRKHMIEEVSLSPGPSHSSGSAQVASRRKKPKSNTQKESLRARKNIEQNNARVSGGSHRPCPTCLKNSVPAEDPPSHSHSSSKKCPFHQKNKCAMAKEAFGVKPEMFIIKIRCK